METPTVQDSIKILPIDFGRIFLTTFWCPSRAYLVYTLVTHWTCVSSTRYAYIGIGIVASEFCAIFDSSSCVSFPVPRSKYLVEYLSEPPAIGCVRYRDEPDREKSKKCDPKYESSYYFFMHNPCNSIFLHIEEKSDTVIV
jgi:hypothetical protein